MPTEDRQILSPSLRSLAVWRLLSISNSVVSVRMCSAGAGTQPLLPFGRRGTRIWSHGLPLLAIVERSTR